MIYSRHITFVVVIVMYEEFKRYSCNEEIGNIMTYSRDVIRKLVIS